MVVNFTARTARARGGGEGARARARGGTGDDGSVETLNLDWENPDARDGAGRARGGGIEGRASSDDDERLTLNGMFCFFRTNSRARRGFGLF